MCTNWEVAIPVAALFFFQYFLEPPLMPFPKYRANIDNNKSLTPSFVHYVSQSTHLIRYFVLDQMLVCPVHEQLSAAEVT